VACHRQSGRLSRDRRRYAHFADRAGISPRCRCRELVSQVRAQLGTIQHPARGTSCAHGNNYTVFSFNLAAQRQERDLTNYVLMGAKSRRPFWERLSTTDGPPAGLPSAAGLSTECGWVPPLLSSPAGPSRCGFNTAQGAFLDESVPGIERQCIRRRELEPVTCQYLSFLYALLPCVQPIVRFVRRLRR
jgi:hypothetical protein